MNLLVCILIGVVLTIVFMYFAVPFIIWTLTIGLVVGYWQWLALLSVELQIFSWIIVALCISFNIPLIRQILISKALFNLFRKVLPPMSNTEKDAIEAGDVWWDGELFQGSPNWDKLHSVPKPLLSAPEQEFLDNQVNTLCELIDDWQVTHNNLDLSPEVWDYLRAEKFFAMLIPKKYNGLEFSALANSTIVQKIATHSLTAAVTTMVPNSLGPAELLLKYGTEQQKDHYLPRLASGKEIPCFALTAPEAGSDAGAIPDRGVICKGNLNGQEIIGIKLNWNKRYITLAPAASLIGLAFKLFDPDRLLSEEVERGITLCLIPRDTPGIQIGRRHFPLNQAFLNGPIHGKDVFIPLDWLIGGEKMIGRGWIMLVECLAAGRGISLPALSTAAGKLSYLTTGAYASIREQFNTPLAKFEGVTASLAKIAGYTYYLEASRLLTVSGIDLGLSPSVITAIAKYHMTEMARTTVILAMDVHAGKGIMLGPNNYLGRGYQGIPISITVEGANILTRNLIIFGQGAIRCHPFIKEEMLAVINDDLKQGLQQFDKAIFAHIKYTISNFIRLIINSLGGGIFCASPDSDLKYYYRQLGRISLALAVTSDIALLILGGKLKRLERLSARLGDVFSHLYLASAVLKYYKDDEENIESNKLYAIWCLKNSLYESQEALIDFWDNFPNRFLGGLFRKTIFIWGRAYKKPDDKLEQQIAEVMTTPNPLRDKLTKDCYLGETVKSLDKAFQKLIVVTPILEKLQNASRQGTLPKSAILTERIELAKDFGILDAKEIIAITEYNELRIRAIMVDDFASDELARQS